MAMQRLEKDQWRGFCDQLSRELGGKIADIEIASLDAGVQLEGRWLPFIGLSYDPRDDIIEIALDGLDHLVFHPRELYADYGAGGLESLGILDEARAWQILLLKDPLKLPPPVSE